MAASAIRDALRACTNGSRSDREKAATSTLVLELWPRLLAILPKQIVVFVRIPGWSSFAVLARYLKSSPLTTRSESLLITTRTAFTVCSRTIGAKSVKPVTFNRISEHRPDHEDKAFSGLTICGKILSLTIFWDKWSIMSGRLSSRQTRRARSGLPNSRTTTGVIFKSYSSSESFLLIRITRAKTFGPPPPNSTDLRSSGKILTLKKSSGKSSDSATVSSSLNLRQQDGHCLWKLISVPQKFFTFCFGLEPHVLNAFRQLNERRVEK